MISMKSPRMWRVACTTIALFAIALLGGCFVWYLTGNSRFTAFHQRVESAASKNLLPGTPREQVVEFARSLGFNGPQVIPRNEWTQVDLSSSADSMILMWSDEFLTPDGGFGTRSVYLFALFDANDTLIKYELQVKESFL